jgi:hypothetical protein
MSKSPHISYDTRAEWRDISHVLTFREDCFLRTIAMLTINGEFQNDNLAKNLRTIVIELKDHSTRPPIIQFL